MSKNDRFFEIIQILRRADHPLCARELSQQLEVSTRTIYRDIATLQSRQVPISGEAGIGYVMRKGYDLPPINFDSDEADAISIGLRMVARTGDIGLLRAARRASRKLNEAAPGTDQLIASSRGICAPSSVDMSTLRLAIRNECKVKLEYQTSDGIETVRVVWPCLLIYYVDTAVLVAWCELRHDIRHFRIDRINDFDVLEDGFVGKGAALIKLWNETRREDSVFEKS